MAQAPSWITMKHRGSGSGGTVKVLELMKADVPSAGYVEMAAAVVSMAGYLNHGNVVWSAVCVWPCKVTHGQIINNSLVTSMET